MDLLYPGGALTGLPLASTGMLAAMKAVRASRGRLRLVLAYVTRGREHLPKGTAAVYVALPQDK